MFNNGWKYLYSDCFKLRYVLAAHWVRDCKELIEIGSYKTPISDFVTGKDRIILIDPLLEDSVKGPEIEAYPVVFLEVEFLPLSPPYGVIWRGRGLCVQRGICFCLNRHVH